MKIVQFSNGKYGVRTYWFFGWYFIDRKVSSLSWSRDGDDFSDCIIDTMDETRSLAKRRSNSCGCRTYKIVEDA